MVGQKARVPPQRVAVRVQHGGSQYPPGPAAHTAHRLTAGGLGCRAEGRCFQRTGGLFQRHGDDERILGTGQRHIQNAHFLAQCLGADSLGQRRIGQRFEPLGRPGRTQHNAHAQTAVGQHRADGIALVKFVVGVRHKNDREFQTLGAMYCHDGDAPRPGLAAHALAQAAVGCGGVHGADQRRQARAACTGGPSRKAQQVLTAARAVGQCAHGGQVAGAGQQFLDQFIHRQCAGQAAVLGQCLDKDGKLCLPAVQHRTVQAALRAGAAQCH